MKLLKKSDTLKNCIFTYKSLYLKVRFLCCSGETKTIKRNRDYYKEKLKETIKLQCENV